MGRKYTPRRAGLRWREGAPDYIMDCFDNKGQTADRYTVFFAGDRGTFHVNHAGPICGGPDEYGNTYVFAMHMSEYPTHPQGVGMTAGFKAYEAAEFRYRFKHRRVRWLDLPMQVRQCAMRFMGDYDGAAKLGA
jgi:hypothetical protein